MQILICGDSFAADWQVKYPGSQGWPNMLAKDYAVTNLAQAGCGEYKIYQQLLSVNLKKFDVVIISHTSPYRLYVKQHPIHHNDPLHANSDLIYSDAVEHGLNSVVEYFEKYFDLEYADFIHGLICKKIDHLLINKSVIHMEHTGESKYKFKDILNFEQLFKQHRGTINYYDEKGNIEIYNSIKSKL